MGPRQHDERYVMAHQGKFARVQNNGQQIIKDLTRKGQTAC
jgi:hypothetical protein